MKSQIEKLTKTFHDAVQLVEVVSFNLQDRKVTLEDMRELMNHSGVTDSIAKILVDMTFDIINYNKKEYEKYYAVGAYGMSRKLHKFMLEVFDVLEGISQETFSKEAAIRDLQMALYRVEVHAVAAFAAVTLHLLTVKKLKENYLGWEIVQE